jgi:hypothetical protein
MITGVGLSSKRHQQCLANCCLFELAIPFTTWIYWTRVSLCIHMMYSPRIHPALEHSPQIAFPLERYKRQGLISKLKILAIEQSKAARTIKLQEFNGKELFKCALMDSRSNIMQNCTKAQWHQSSWSQI